MPSFTPPFDRAIAAGRQLIEIHDWLRDELAQLRTGRGSALTAHCVAFCAAVSRHHTSEDAGAFVELARTYPELRPVLDELIRDHAIVADLLRRVEALATDNGGADRVQGELDGLAALLESHFTYEERKLTSALDALSPPPALW